jgi:hypothetical protein
LLVVPVAAGVGISTLRARLAGTIPGAVLLDADILAEDLVSVVSTNDDYPAFRRSMMRLAHELAQNNVVVLYFFTMLPEQVLANTDVDSYIDSVHFICLTCPPDARTHRLARRDGSGVVAARIEVWLDVNDALVAAAGELTAATCVDAGRPMAQIEGDLRHWIKTRLRRWPVLRTNPSG